MQGGQDAVAAELALQERIGHRFAQPALLEQALTHSSVADPARGALDSNERLEFIGDRVLALLMAEWLAERFPAEREGALGRRLGHLVAWDTLAGVAQGLGLGPLLRVPPTQEDLRRRDNVLADAVEALLGALYLDAGLEPARRLVRAAWASLVETGGGPPASPKNRLQEWLQGHGHPLPEYRLASSSGPPHQPVFVVAVTAQGREAEGRGESKRAAEQAAAEAWLAGLPDQGVPR
jgi:ribonuclease-3